MANPLKAYTSKPIPRRPAAGTEIDMEHIRIHGCPPLPTASREPYPYERMAMYVFWQRVDEGESGTELGRAIDLSETHSVGWGGHNDRAHQAIVKRWNELRADGDRKVT